MTAPFTLGGTWAIVNASSPVPGGRSLHKDLLSIRAKKETENEDKEKNYLRRERVYPSFERMVSFPEEVSAGKAEGSMKDGILELKIPKKEPKPEDTTRKIELK